MIQGNAIWRDVIALLVSCEAYRCASLALFGPPAPLNHWQVIQVCTRLDKFMQFPHCV